MTSRYVGKLITISIGMATVLSSASALSLLIKLHSFKPQIEAALVIERMRQMDNILLGEFAAEYEIHAEARHDGNWNRPLGEHYDDQINVSSVQITYNNTSISFMNRLLSLCHFNTEKIAFYTSPDEAGNPRWRSLPEITYSLRNPQLNVDYIKHISAFFDASGCIAERSRDFERMILYSPDENGYAALYTDVMLFCSGRGYTQGLEKVIRLLVRADGLWELHAIGYYPDFRLFPDASDKREWKRAEWKLVIDPETLLVREAYWNGRLFSRTEGVFGTDFKIAAVGHFYYMEELIRYTVVFRSAQPRFNDRWYQAVVEAINNPEDGTFVYDKRFIEPPLSFTYKKQQP